MGWQAINRHRSFAYGKEVQQKQLNKLSFQSIAAAFMLPAMGVFMSACSSTPDKGAVEEKSVAEKSDVSAQSAISENLLNIDSQTMFEIMAAEMMLKRKQPRAAFDTLYPIAERLRDAGLAERVFQISMMTYDVPRIENATYLWRDIEPESAVVWRASFIMSLRSGKVEQALDEWKQFQKLSGDNLPSDLISSATKVGSAVAEEYGIPFFQKLITLYPEEWASHYALGMVCTAYNNAETGIPALNQAKKLMAKEDGGESEGLIYNLLSKLYLIVEPPEKGVEALKPYVQRHPEDLLVQERLARLEVQAQRYEEAEKRYRYIVQQEPMAHTSIFSLALLQMEREAYAEAEQNLLKISKQKGYQSIAYYYLGILYQDQNQFGKAKTYFNQVKASSYLTDSRLHLAEILFAEGNKVEAYQTLDSLKPDNKTDKVKVLRAKAIFATSEDDYRKAIEIYNQALSIEPNSVAILKAESLLFYKLEEFSDYETVLLKALKIDGRDSEVLNALGYYYVERNIKLDTAFVFLKKALEIEPDSYFIMDSMGWYYFRVGSYDLALDYLQKAFDGSKDDEVFAHLIEVYWVKGEHEKARALWQEYRQEFKDNPKVENIIKDLERGGTR